MAVDKIQFFDLSRQIRALRPELEKAVGDVLSEGQFVLGDPVKKLEAQIAGLVGAPEAVAVASGTDGLLLSLIALGVGENDAVITTPFTFFSTAGSVVRAGARPLFVDINPKTFNINIDRVERLVGEECRRESSGDLIHTPTGLKLKGILPVHLFGLMADMERLEAVAAQNGLFIVEDAAQAIGAWEQSARGRRMAGSVGDAGVFSFYPTKNLGAFGDAGMVATRRDDVAGRIRLLRVHGQGDGGDFETVGYLSRMDSIQAAVLSAKLSHLAEWNGRRCELASRYIESIGSYGWSEKIALPRPDEGKGHTYHQFCVRVEKRDELREHLNSLGIGSAIYYPRPLHLQHALAFLGYREGDLPEAEKAAKQILALPIWPELTDSEQGRVVEAIASFFG